MSMKSDWQSQKKRLEKVKVDTSVFKHNLSGALEDFETAVKKFDAENASLKRDPVKLSALRGKLVKASDKLSETGKKYEASLHYLSEHATDSAQKAALKAAAAYMLGVMHATFDARKKHGARAGV